MRPLSSEEATGFRGAASASSFGLVRGLVEEERIMSKPKNTTKITQPQAGSDNAAPEELSDEQLDQVVGGAIANPPAAVVDADLASVDVGQGSSSGGGAGKATFSQITITRTTDKASPVL
jgi:hypothetical protein